MTLILSLSIKLINRLITSSACRPFDDWRHERAQFLHVQFTTPEHNPGEFCLALEISPLPEVIENLYAARTLVIRPHAMKLSYTKQREIRE